jgi:2-polyprenyl-3-methyl-5-hydroxy-6-metoxy-1,4-benzoquinol methylase
MVEWMRVPTDCKRAVPLVSNQVYWCGACEFGSLLPTPPIEQIAESYRIDHYYTHGTSHFVEPLPDSWLDRLRVRLAWRMDQGKPLVARRVHELLAERPSRIIDIGCGAGELLMDLDAMGHEVVGVEIDPASTARQVGTRLKVFSGTAEDLPAELTPASFDCVLLSHVLEHCRQPIVALRNLHALLKPDGLLLCEVPNNAALALERQGCSWEMLDVPRHLQFFTRNSLAAAMDMAGFHVETTWHAHFLRQFTNQWIGTEQALWHNLMVDKPSPVPPPKRNSRLEAWLLLAQCLMSGPDRRHDSVGVAARPRKPATSSTSVG